MGGEGFAPIQIEDSLGVQQESSSIGTVRLRLTAKSRYDKIDETIDSLFERYNHYAMLFATYEVESTGYSFICEMNNPVVMNDFMTVFDMSTMQCETDNGYDIVFRQTKIHIRNMSENQFYDFKDKLQRIVTYYG